MLLRVNTDNLFLTSTLVFNFLADHIIRFFRIMQAKEALVMQKVITFLLLALLSQVGLAEDKVVTGLLVSGIEQTEDDEEAPFDIYARNKAHKCGGKSSNLFRFYNEYDAVAHRKFLLVLTAMKQNWSMSMTTDGCDGRALMVKNLRLERK
jgi:hypothetical protein